MTNTRLKTAVILLKQVRSDMHGNVDARVTKELDEAIAILEDGVKADDVPATAKAALARIGRALKYLPLIKSLFENLL